MSLTADISQELEQNGGQDVPCVGVDTGGTFTDIVLRLSGRLYTHKVLSTPQNPALAVLTGVREILQEHNVRADDVSIVHGSTVATNALLERKGACIALVTTAGFEDVLEIGRQARPSLYDLSVERSAPLVPADRRFGIPERTLHTGQIEQQIQEADLESLAAELATLELDAIAICFLFAYVNPENEQTAARFLARLGLPISCSHAVLPEYREYARFSTTVASAYIRPTLERHLATLRDADRFPKSFRLMLSNGGCIAAAHFESAGIGTVLSGPAGGVLGAARVAKSAGYERIITFDMGGTSSDVSLCDGAPAVTTESTISGLPIKVPVIDIHTVGAGGGSIASVDAGGALRVGPESAGADPGPICYGRHGTAVTVTDANLYLGRIASTQFLGGRLSLDVARSRAHLETFAAALGVRPNRAAEGILKVADATMERAIKVISVARGYDTRDFTLVSFGGAGGLHAAFIAENLGIGTVLVPPNGGVLSAYGMLFADTIKDYSQTRLSRFDARESHLRPLTETLNIGFETLLARAVTEMAREGYVSDQLTINRALDVRYEGQSYELTIPCLEAMPLRSESVTALVSEFHAAHAARFGYARTEAPVELVTLRLTAIGETDKPDIQRTPLAGALPDAAARIGQDTVIFEGDPHLTDFYQRERLRAGNSLRGPAVITEFSATTVVPPGFAARVDEYRNLVLVKT